MPRNNNIIAADSGNIQNYLGLAMDWKATGERTGGALALVEACGSPGCEPPMHYHEDADEFFYVIDGEMTFRVGEERERIGKGGFVWIPKKTVHGFMVHLSDTRFLFGFVPAGLERMFMTMDTPAGPDAQAGEPSAQSTTANAHRERYGTIVVGPPLTEVLTL